MPQSGYTPIQLYYSTTAAAAPTAGNLLSGELAINLTDEKLYFKNASGVVKLLASNSGSLGSVTSVDVSGGTTGLTTSGGPITTSGTITLAGTLVAANGGTGQSSYTTGDLLYASGTTTLSKLADVATGNALISGGVGVAPSWGKIGLTTHVSGTLGVANGGTGTATAFTAGSVVFAGASGVYSQDNANLFWDDTNNRLGIGTSSPSALTHIYGSSPRPIVEGSGNGNYATWKYISKTSGGATVNFEQGVGIAADNAFETYDNQNTQLVSRYISGASGYWSWFTNGTEKMRILSGGNVGIGTSSPGQKLTVAGTIETTSGGVKFPDGTTQTTAAAGTSAYELITTATASAAASVDFTGLSSTYQQYILVCDQLYGSASSFLLLRTSTDNGSTFASSATSYAYNRTYVSNSATQTLVSTEDTDINMGQMSSSASYGHYLYISMQGAGAAKAFSADFTNSFYITTTYRYAGTGFRKSQTAVNAIRLLCSTGTMTGTFKLYGVKA